MLSREPCTVPGICSGADARHGLDAADDVLSPDVAAGFRRHLVLQQDAREAGSRKAPNSPLHIHRVAIPEGRLCPTCISADGYCQSFMPQQSLSVGVHALLNNCSLQASSVCMGFHMVANHV